MLKKYEFLIIYFIGKGAVETDEFKLETEDELTSCCPDISYPDFSTIPA